MGYLGLKHMGDSDNAADLGHDVQEAMANVLLKRLGKTDNVYNTDGPIDVALVFEALIIPAMKSFDCTKLYNLALETIKKLEEKFDDAKKGSVEDWGSHENKKMHVNAYNRMLKSMKKFANNK